MDNLTSTVMNRVVKNIKNKLEYELITYVNGVRNGDYMRYVMESLVEKGSYLNGNKDGTFTTYRRGEIRTEIDYKDGKINGRSVKYHTEEDISYNGEIIYGTIKEITYYINGLLESNMEIVKYKRADSDILREHLFNNYGELMRKIQYMKDKSIIDIEYKPHTLLKTITHYYDSDYNIKKEEVEYIDNKRNGRSIKYYDNGNVKEECSMIDNILDGEYKSYYDNGQLKKTFKYRRGKRYGVYQSYYDNGTSKELLNYSDDDNLHGLHLKYNVNGAIIENTNYRNNKKDGQSIKWNDRGKPYKIIDYKNGDIDRILLWDE
jgi:antitoxin component YwqK of YwqJK toxin-antitoxin module